MRRDINCSLHGAFNLTNCDIRIDEGQYQHYRKQIEGISRATVIPALTESRPTFRTEAIGAAVGR